MRQAIGVGLFGVLVGMLPLHGFGQTAADRGPDGKTKTTIPGVEVLPFKGVPFTGTDTIVRVRPVEGGSSVVTSEVSLVVRDSQGRIYRESHHFGLMDADPQKTLYMFHISDPLTHTRADCTLATRRCKVTAYRPRLNTPLAPTGPFDSGRQILVRERLGEKTVDGLNLVGSRETTTILPGTVGNDRTLTLTREFWYSPDLKNNISVDRADPREGTQAVRLAVLSRSEPDSSAFSIPSDYSIIDLRVNAKP